MIGTGPSARTHVMEIKPFTFVGATTRPGMLSSPLRGRFGILLRLEFYTDDELRFVVERSAEVIGVPIDRDGRRREIGADAVARDSEDCESVVAAGAGLCPGSGGGQDRSRYCLQVALEMLEVDVRMDSMNWIGGCCGRSSKSMMAGRWG